TDLLRVEIDPRGGNVVVADLLAYPRQPNQDEPVRLLDTRPATFFEAQGGLVGVQGSTLSAPDHNANYNAEHDHYELAPGSDTLEVALTATGGDGLAVRKVYVFERASYV